MMAVLHPPAHPCREISFGQWPQEARRCAERDAPAGGIASLPEDTPNRNQGEIATQASSPRNRSGAGVSFTVFREGWRDQSISVKSADHNCRGPSNSGFLLGSICGGQFLQAEA